MVAGLSTAKLHLLRPITHYAPLLSSRGAKPIGVRLLPTPSRTLVFSTSGASYPVGKNESFRPPSWLLQMELASGSFPAAKSKRRRELDGALLKDAGESAVKKAFSSMVFMIREIHSYSLQLMELLFLEDLKGVFLQVQKEVNASFCWLFHQIFSCTPTLMLSLMLLLANFTVHSMSHSAAAAAAPPPHVPALSSAAVIKATHLGGGGGGRNMTPLAWANDDGRSPPRPETAVVERLEEEAAAWRRTVAEASQMEAMHVALRGREVRRRMVAPVAVDVEDDRQYLEYFRTELMYRRALADRPHDELLLSNFAQFLFLVVHDHDRAEQYFKRAISQQPAEAETLSRYANFLWLAKNDLCLAEETYLEAINADPSNATYAANYAHFLWSTGGHDTCFPLDDLPKEA